MGVVDGVALGLIIGIVVNIVGCLYLWFLVVY